MVLVGPDDAFIGSWRMLALAVETIMFPYAVHVLCPMYRVRTMFAIVRVYLRYCGALMLL
jgi:hypothetical protein